MQKALQIEVNGVKLHVLKLKNGETRVVDVSSAMSLGDNDTMG
jgi:hypothetical protein